MADMDQQEMTDALREEIEGLTSTDRAAVLLLLLGEQEAANIIKYMDPKEVQRIGAAGECRRYVSGSCKLRIRRVRFNIKEPNESGSRDQ